ncbi:MAG: hypothetical protein KDA05_05075 [Phycisphaerales bacterium]|nr:hypothetical protein [Phycisphaerales bacterium]MCB9840644.1 hypothetical protein [Phycisphaeraceae bacterium]
MGRSTPSLFSARLFVAWSYAIAAVLGVGLVAYGVWEHDRTFAVLGVAALAVVGLGLPVTLVAMAGRGAGDTRAVVEAVERLIEHSALSDDARRVLNRRSERHLLRQAIEEDMHHGDHEAALVLVRELAERFGYRSDAEELRARIEAARFEAVEHRITEAIARLDSLIGEKRWDEAMTEAARITRTHPDSHRVEGLRHRVERARAQYKADLERRFLLAAQQDRVDEALGLLHELDQYMTEQEAGPLQEVARGVIGKARENLGVQFRLAVQDRRWRHAAEIGDRIIAEFPNTRMAQEVRGMIDGIRSRAAAVGQV